MTDFLKRHRKVICVKYAKETSPKRSSDVMNIRTQQFVDELDPLFHGNLINRNNLFVFDETLIGQSAHKLLVVGERRKSGGGNINKYVRVGKRWAATFHFQSVMGLLLSGFLSRRVL